MKHPFKPGKIKVLTKTGEQIALISDRCTSVGASQVARGPVEYSLRFGVPAWVKK